MAELSDVLADLRAESADLDGHVAQLPAAQWSTPTPAPGWTIADQIGHLAWTDDVSTLAATDAAQFQAELTRALAQFDGYIDRVAAERARQPPPVLLDTWRAGRSALTIALGNVAPATKLPWFGPPMSATSMATARIMETWAHGQDVVDALGLTRAPTNRLRHVAHIGVRTRNFAYLVRELVPPTEEFRFELVGPDGDAWIWGPDDATDHVAGPALDFCLLVTQRRHADDLALHAAGPRAEEWITIAQAFAGPPGPGREARASS